jgi:hypothetical protein
VARPSQPGDLISDRYELEELVDSGGMSALFRAHDRQLERRVAIKILHERYADDAEYVERFRREARAVARVSHPNIVTVIDRGVDGGRQYIVFEHVEGESLKELVLRSGRLPLHRAVELALAVADGLAFAHGHGLVHRDVKPQNVLLSSEGEVKVTDFGIASSLDVEDGVTQTGTVVGTGEYLAPEEASGEVSPATDLYSLGVVLWELLTGDVPFGGGNSVAAAVSQLNEPLPSLREQRPDAPPRLAAAVERALATDPARRFPSMSALAAELRACLSEIEGEAPVEDDRALTLVSAPVPEPAPAGAPAPAPRRRRTRSRRRLVAFAMLALAAAGAALVAVLLLSGASHPQGGSGGGGGGGGGGSAVAPVQLNGLTAYDPQGHPPTEHDADAPKATDGDPATYWTTDIYKSRRFGNLKSGVGLVLDAGHPVALRRLTITTDTPGLTAVIKAGNSSDGGFAIDSSPRTVNGTATFALRGATARYYLVWITELPPGGVAHLNEVTGSR